MARVWNMFLITSGVVAGWLGLSATVMVLTDAAPGAMVLFPGGSLMAELPDAAAILDANHWSVTVSSAPGRTRALYSAGAVLVLPAGLTGCLRPAKG